MATLAKIFIEMGLKNDGLVKGLDGSASKLDSVSKGMTKTGVAMTAGVTVPALAAGKALLDLGADSDTMVDTLAVNTGATGEVLDGLAESTIDVFETIPTSMESATEAIGTFHQLTGQTGDGLEEISTAALELSRVTGEDLNAVVEGSGQLFNQWNVAAGDQVEVMDDLFIASQQTGVSYTDLADQVTKFGPTLQSLGFTVEESTAFLASLGEAGLDASTVMGGMKKAVTEFANAGVTDMGAALGGVFDQIKNAPDDVTAMQIAMETFGNKAGPALAESIRAGNLEFEELLTLLETGEGSIVDTAAATNDASEEMAIMKNQVKAAAIPLGTALFTALAQLMPFITDLVGYLAQMITWFTNLPGPVQKVIFVLVAILAVLGPVLAVVGPLIPMIGALSAILPILGAAFTLLLGPVGLVIAIVALLFIAWQTNLFGIRDITAQVFSAIWDWIQQLIAWFGGDGFGQILNMIGEYGAKLIEFAETAIVFYLTLPIKIAEILLEVVKQLGDWVGDVVDSVSGLGDDILEGIGNGLELLYQFGVDIIQGLVNGMLGMIPSVKDAFTSLLDAGFGEVKDFLGIGSPSKLFMGIGQNVVQGFNIGVREEDVDIDLSERIPPIVPGAAQAASPGAGGIRGGMTLILQAGAIVVEGAGNADEVADRVVQRLMAAADRVQMSHGAA